MRYELIMIWQGERHSFLCRDFVEAVCLQLYYRDIFGMSAHFDLFERANDKIIW